MAIDTSPSIAIGEILAGLFGGFTEFVEIFGIRHFLN
jgi:hypothetical protein